VGGVRVRAEATGVPYLWPARRGRPTTPCPSPYCLAACPIAVPLRLAL